MTRWPMTRFSLGFPQLFRGQSVEHSVATMAIQSDLELMLRIKDGDAASFEVLLLRYRIPLVSFLHRMVRDRALAEDLAQEVFLRVYQARERYQPEARFTTWLYRIATNLALNAIRDRKDKVSEPAGAESNGEPALERFVDPQPTVEQRLIERDRERLIRQAVESLPENQCVAVILHKYQEVDYRQIAGVLNVSESAVKSLLFRAYETLRLRLAPLLREGQI
jgi:RNA polymerase sigma-70 factor (ECF subfamily)